MKTQPATAVIRNGQLVDGTGGATISVATVIVEDGRIAYAGASPAAPRLRRMRA